MFSQAVNKDIYLSPHLVGGVLPIGADSLEKIVRDAAAQALGTESVAIHYRIHDGRCWYLAMPAADLASHPNSWCPLTLALPGGPAYADQSLIYWYEQNGHVAALLWDGDVPQFRLVSGPTRMVLPRLQTMGKPAIQIMAEGHEILDWKMPQLKQERDLRRTINMLNIAGLAVILLSILVLYYVHLTMRVHKPSLLQAQMRVQEHQDRMLEQSAMLAKSPTRYHLDNIQYMIDHVRLKNGVLAKYEINPDGRGAVWEVLLPQTVSDYSIGKFTGESQGVSGDWRVRIKGEL